jgi:hypothetical protein
MKKKTTGRLHVDHHLGCFGEFNATDRLCTALCALRLRCVIERDQNVRMEILEELVSSEGIPLKIQ